MQKKLENDNRKLSKEGTFEINTIIKLGHQIEVVKVNTYCSFCVESLLIILYHASPTSIA